MSNAHGSNRRHTKIKPVRSKSKSVTLQYFTSTTGLEWKLVHNSAKPETDKVTHTWLAQERHKGMPLCGPILQAQATNNGNAIGNKLFQVSKFFMNHLTRVMA